MKSKEDDKSVLLLEDDVKIKNKIKSILEKNGYSVDTSIDSSLGDDAIIKMIETIQPKLIILNKHELCETIESATETKNIPVMIVSDIDSELQKQYKTNAKYIKYPFNTKDLLGSVYYNVLSGKETKAKDKHVIDTKQYILAAADKASTQEMLRTLPPGVFKVDSTGKCTSANNSFCALIAKTRKEVIGQRTWIHKDELKGILEGLGELQKKNHDYAYILERTYFLNETKCLVQIIKDTDKKEGYIGTITPIITQDSELTKEQERSHAIVNTLNEGILYLSVAKGVEFYNDSARDILANNIHNFKESDLVAAFTNIVDENGNVLKASEYTISKTLRYGISIHGEILGLQKGQEKDFMWASVNSTPVFEEGSKQASAAIISFIDVTKEKEASDALKDNRAKLDSIVNATPELISFQDVNERFLVINKAMLKLFGISPKEYKDKTSKEIIATLKPQHKKIFKEWNKQNIQKSLKKTDTKEIQLTIAKDKKKIYDTIRLPLTKEKEGIDGLVIVARDITLKRELQDRLGNTLRERNIILENTISGIAYIKQNKYIWTNKHFAEIFGYNKQEMQNKTLKLIYPFGTEEYNKFTNSIDLAFEKDNSYSFDFPALCKDGSIIWCNFAGKLVNPKSVKDGAIFVIENISTAKAEKEILTLHRNQLEKILQKQAVEIEYINTRLAQETQKHAIMTKELSAMKDTYAEIFEHSDSSIIELRAMTNLADQKIDFLISDLNTKATLTENITKTDVQGKSIKTIYDDNTLMQNLEKILKHGLDIIDKLEKNNKRYIIYKLGQSEIVLSYKNEN